MLLIIGVEYQRNGNCNLKHYITHINVSFLNAPQTVTHVLYPKRIRRIAIQFRKNWFIKYQIVVFESLEIFWLGYCVIS